MEIIKICSGCKIPKSVVFFSSNRAQKDGFSNQCKACNSIAKNKQTLKKQSIRLSHKIELLANEVFKDVIYNGITFEYKISNLGRLISLKNGGEILMKPTQEPGRGGRSGYLATALRYPDKSKYYTVRVHRLVAIAFIENPYNYDQVNHIDGDKSNNNSNNLEWCDSKHNIRHSFETGLNIPKNGKDSHMYGKGRKVLLNGVIYDTIADCARQTGYKRTSLSSELDGRMKTKVGISYV